MMVCRSRLKRAIWLNLKKSKRELRRAGRRYSGMSISLARYLPSATLICAGLLVGAPASAQANDTYVAPGRYSSDYEVGTWSASDRTRSPSYLEQQYLSSDELLGGPVAKPGEPAFERVEIIDRGAIRPELKTARFSGGGGDRTEPTLPEVPAAGMRVEAVSGQDIGSVAMVQSGDGGDVDAVWVRTQTGDVTDLVQIERGRFEVQRGRIIISG